ncbi:MAG: hypothetical protein HWE16_15655 [Gammaproteobacteria bacterium]|nr:hypothetical protein [Gammaproteobacteria bacterium]
MRKYTFLILPSILLLVSCFQKSALNWTDSEWKRNYLREIKYWDALGVPPYHSDAVELYSLYYLPYSNPAPHVYVYKKENGQIIIHSAVLEADDGKFEDCVSDLKNLKPEHCKAPKLKAGIKRELSSREWNKVQEMAQQVYIQQKAKSDEDKLVGVDGWGFQVTLETNKLEESYYEWMPNEGALYEFSLYLLKLGELDFHN